MRIPSLVAILVVTLPPLSACLDSPSGLAPDPGRIQSSSRGGVPAELVSVCHGPPASAQILELPALAAAAHLQHGDYVTTLLVDDETEAHGDGVHFARIGDAIAAARTARFARQERRSGACRITIAVGPGVFEGSVAPPTNSALEHFPLFVDVPDVTLRGAFRMQLDAGGRATGEHDAEEHTTLVASPGLLTVRGPGPQSGVSEPLVIVTKTTDGFVGDGVVVEGFVFRSGNEAPDATVGGAAVYAIHVSQLVVRGNRIDGGFSTPIQIANSSAEVAENFLSGRAGSNGIGLAGPGHFAVTGNRLVGPGGIPGILVLPMSFLRVPPGVEQQVLPTEAHVTATVTNNEVRNHLQPSAGAGLRVVAVGVQGSDIVSTSRVTATGNTFVGNTFGVYVEAGFPAANTRLRGDVELTLTNNTVTRNCQANLYVAFTRGSGLWGDPLRPYLRQSTYTLRLGGDLAWDDAWYAHPEGYDNRLVVDGRDISNGIRLPFDASRQCPS